MVWNHFNHIVFQIRIAIRVFGIDETNRLIDQFQSLRVMRVVARLLLRCLTRTTTITSL